MQRRSTSGRSCIWLRFTRMPATCPCAPLEHSRRIFMRWRLGSNPVVSPASRWNRPVFTGFLPLRYLRGTCGPSRPRHHLPAGRGRCHRHDGTRHPRRYPPIASATAMRMIAVHAQTERKRLDRSVRRAEKRRPWARKQRLRGLIRPVPAACATAEAGRGKKCLYSEQIQANLASDGRPLGECRHKY